MCCANKAHDQRGVGVERKRWGDGGETVVEEWPVNKPGDWWWWRGESEMEREVRRWSTGLDGLEGLDWTGLDELNRLPQEYYQNTAGTVY